MGCTFRRIDNSKRVSNKLLFSDSRPSAVLGGQATDVKRVRYPCRSILTVKALGKALDLEPALLAGVAEHAASEYRIAGRKKKPDGSIRLLWDARYPLKLIQTRIKEQLLDRVIFPAYLFGGIRGKSHISNARSHSGAKLLIAEDVASYFPSITAAHVFSIWRHVFGFSKSVARMLTKLTTRADELPQGAKTSPQLSNIALWRVEPGLVQRLNQLGMRYSRFVDDISISSRRKHPLFVIQKVTRQVYGALYRAGFNPKFEKHEFSWRGRTMAVTKLNIDAKISLPAVRRKALGQDAQRLLAFAKAGNFNRTSMKLTRSLSTRAGAAKRFHPRLARKARSIVQNFASRRLATSTNAR